MNGVNLSIEDKANKSITTHVWFSWILERTPLQAKNIVALFMLVKDGEQKRFFIYKRAFIQTPVDLNVQHITSGMQKKLESANVQAVNSPNQANVQRAVPAAETNQLSQGEMVPGRYRSIPFSLQHPGTSRVRTGNGSSNSGKTDTEDPCKGYYLQQALKEAKFTGFLEQSIQTSLQMFNVYSKQFQLTNSQKSDLFIHALDGAARTFIFNNTNESMTFEQKVDIMLKEYDSDARQLQVKGRLDALRLKTFMTQHGINDVSDGSTKLVQQIDELTPQTHPDFRSDAHKISYLRKAVAEFQSWCRNPIQSITANNHTFNSFVTALHEIFVLQKELELIKNKMTGHSFTTGSSYFQQYAQNPRQLKSRRGGKQSGHRGRNLMTTPRTTYGSENNHRFEDARRKGCVFAADMRGHVDKNAQKMLFAVT